MKKVVYDGLNRLNRSPHFTCASMPKHDSTVSAKKVKVQGDVYTATY